MDIAKGFTYITEDERWLAKIGIAAGVMVAATIFLLIPLPLLIGYQLGITRNVMNGEKKPLPEWENLGALFMDGLYVLIARIIYTLPFLLLVCVGVGISVLPAFSTNNSDVTNVLAGVTVVTWLLISCFGLLFVLALLFISPAINIQYARTGNFGACLRFSEVLGIARAHIADILIVVVALFLANLVLQSVSGMLAATFCGIVLALPISWVGSAWLSATSGHLYGQIAAKGDSLEKFSG